MKKTLLFAGLILALTASFAMAAGVSVNWKTACWGEEPLTNLTWTCTTNSNLNIRMTTSFKLDADYPGFVGVGVYMEGMVEAVAVPDWWEMSNMDATDCRYNLFTMSADGSVLLNGGADVCFDPWGGTGGFPVRRLAHPATEDATCTSFWRLAPESSRLGADGCRPRW